MLAYVKLKNTQSPAKEPVPCFGFLAMTEFPSLTVLLSTWTHLYLSGSKRLVCICRLFVRMILKGKLTDHAFEMRISRLQNYPCPILCTY